MRTMPPELHNAVDKGLETFREMLFQWVEYAGGKVDHDTERCLNQFLIEVSGFVYKAGRIHGGKE